MQSKTLAILGIAMVLGLFLPGTALAADILCEDVTKNHMLVDDDYVSACLDAGAGNLTGNPANDAFLTGVGGAYELIDKSDDPGSDIDFTQNNGSGTFSFSPSLWSTYSEIAIGFKFGTGNIADEWFVFLLQPNVASGAWTFVNMGGKGGGLSHVALYGTEGVSVSEPATLSLLAMGLLGVGFTRRTGAAHS
jgi:hypothetical protein